MGKRCSIYLNFFFCRKSLISCERKTGENALYGEQDAWYGTMYLNK